jgi:hypothetical protein
MHDNLVAAMRCSIARTDALRTQHVTKLERTVTGLQDVLLDLAAHAMQLADSAPPSDPDNAAIVEPARKILA